ncbi:MAG: hypothetical protein JWO25_2808 [Alphaproteobacteria bacterium]|nr:hypothetical protein [Alphaproteobacteria bacterium]
MRGCYRACMSNSTKVSILAFALTLSGCSNSAPSDQNQVGEIPVATVAHAVATSARPSGCADRIGVELDRPLMVREDGAAFADPRLNDFQNRVEKAFRRAADAACRNDPKLVRALKPVRSVLVRSGAGADEPTFHVEPPKANVLMFEWHFGDVDLAVPERSDIEDGLRCWAGPERKECSDRGD